MSHSSANDSGSLSPMGGSSHNPSPPPPHHGFPSGPGQPYQPGPYPGYPGPYPFPPPIPGYPYPPLSNLPNPPVLPPLYYVPPPPRRSSLAPLWITLGIVLAVVVVVCASCSVLLALSVRSLSSDITSVPPVPPGLDPIIVAANFCAYETNKDYVHAFAQLSENLQSQLPVQQFISDNQARDATVGPVIGCSAALPASSVGQIQASPTVTLTVHVWFGPETGNGPPVGKSGTMTMAEEATEWKVDAVDSTLQLT